MTDIDRRHRRLQRKEARVEDIKKQRATFEARKRNKRIINITLILVVVLALGYGLARIGTSDEGGEYDAFARCLTEKGAIMYGTEWCPHCQEQKREFGKSFRYVNYINCDLNAQACELAGVEGYPTWVFATGPPVSGKQELTTLAERTECVIA